MTQKVTTSTWSCICRHPINNLFRVMYIWKFHFLMSELVSHRFEIILWIFLLPYKLQWIQKTGEKLRQRLFFDIIGEENKILKIWGTVLLPLLSSFKQIFHPVCIVNKFWDKEPHGPSKYFFQSIIRKW